MKLNDYKNSFHVLALTDSQPQQNHKKSENIRTAALFDKCFFFSFTEGCLPTRIKKCEDSTPPSGCCGGA